MAGLESERHHGKARGGDLTQRLGERRIERVAQLLFLRIVVADGVAPFDGPGGLDGPGVGEQLFCESGFAGPGRADEGDVSDG